MSRPACPRPSPPPAIGNTPAIGNLPAIAMMMLVLFALRPLAADEFDFFEKQIRPTLTTECIRCHGEKRQRGGLRLDSAEGWMTGGDSGPAIVPGKPDDSLLIQAIRYQNADFEMPPKGILPAEKIAAFEKWVTDGAADPRASQDPAVAPTRSPSVEEGKSFWSFQPIGRPPVPMPRDRSWPKSDIDRFVLAKLESHQLRPVDDADKMSLLRRLSFDLIGLPPTPAEMESFLSDPSDEAYAKLVDRLLDSPAFGERWGRHWLDVVRFAESSGGGRTLLFPNAWRYRDYVIESFNQDLPYDQFLREQLAGDLLESDDWAERRRQWIATAFLLLGPTNYELQDKDVLEMDVVDEQLDTIGKSMLGMTIGCARCHDHKFDPIPARDYYAMAGIFKSTKAMIHSNVSTWNKVELPLPPEEEKTYRQQLKRLAAAKEELKKATKRLKVAGGKSPAKDASDRSIPAASLPGIVIDDIDAKRVGQWTESTSIAGYVGKHYIHDGTERKGEKSVLYEADLEPGSYEVRVTYTSGSNRSTRVPIHVHHAGGTSTIRVDQKSAPKIDASMTSLGEFRFESQAKVEVSNRGTEDGVVIADSVVFINLTKKLSKQIDREALNADSVAAKTDTTDDHKKAEELATLQAAVNAAKEVVDKLEKQITPREIAMVTGDDDTVGDIHVAIRGVVHNQGELTPRGVMQVAASEPFPTIPTGQSGRREFARWVCDPRNPLPARVMVNRVWHWLIGTGIVASVDNFGSTGNAPTHPELLDHLASTFIDDGWSVKQLIRRIVHSRAYRLSTDVNDVARAKDPSNRWLWRMNRKRLHAEDIRDTLLFVSGKLDRTVGGPSIKPGTKSEYGYTFESLRRSVYVPVFRNRLPEIFEVFDFADPNIQRGRRNTSTIASQALFLMNHPFVIDQANTAAARMLGEVDGDRDARIHHVYRQILGRSPSDGEFKIAKEFLSGDDSENEKKWGMLYQSLFQSVDFRYLN